jgi:hypothetical protein
LKGLKGLKELKGLKGLKELKGLNVVLYSDVRVKITGIKSRFTC